MILPLPPAPPSFTACVHQQDLRELVSSDSLDAFVLSYSSILAMYSGLTPDILQRLVAVRSDMTRADVAEVIAQCREVFKQHVKAQQAAAAAAAPAGLNTPAAGLHGGSRLLGLAAGDTGGGRTPSGPSFMQRVFGQTPSKARALDF